MEIWSQKIFYEIHFEEKVYKQIAKSRGKTSIPKVYYKTGTFLHGAGLG